MEKDDTHGERENRYKATTGNSDGLLQKAEILADNAEGYIHPEMLCRMEAPKEILSGARSDGRNILYQRPLIDYIEEDEQPQHLLYNENRGLKTVYSDGHEETPHHNQGRDKFLLATNKRLLYIAAYQGEDVIQEFDYSDIVKAGVTTGHVAERVEFHTDAGCQYLFIHQAPGFHQEAMVGFIRTKADALVLSEWRENIRKMKHLMNRLYCRITGS